MRYVAAALLTVLAEKEVNAENIKMILRLKQISQSGWRFSLDIAGISSDFFDKQQISQF